MINSNTTSRIRALIRPDPLRSRARSETKLPELTIRKEIAVGRAYDEYCCRTESGETVDAEVFCNDHSEFRSALFRRIELHKYLDENPDTLEYLEPIPWPKVGESFGNCTLLEELGYGGAGRVFLAKEQELSRRIVFKLVAGDNGEADRLCRLKHPYIVPIYYVRQDRDSGLTAICMPFESRYTLNDFLDAAFRNQTVPSRFGEVLNRLFPDESNSEGSAQAELKEMSFVDGVLSIGRRLSEALDHSHRAGIYHLDLKPSNVLVQRDGTPLLIDFNLAVNAGQNAEVMGGTKPYMSPEQIQHLLFPFSPDVAELDGKSDVYSLGVMLSQILTGEHPFGALSWSGTEHQLLLKQQDWKPAEFEPFANVDAKIVGLLADCLAAVPEQRIESAELAGRFEEILRQRRGNWTGSRRRYLVVSTTVAAGIAAGFIAKYHFQPTAKQLHRDGLRQIRNEQYEDGISSLTRSIGLNPNNADVWGHRALAVIRRGEDDCFVEGLSDYEEAYRRSRDPAFKAGIGLCQANLRKHEKAVTHLVDAIDGGIESAEIFNVLGFCQMRLTYHDEAEDSFNKALQKKSQFQAALYNRAANELQRSDALQREINRTAVADIESALSEGEEDPSIFFLAACIWDRLPDDTQGRTAKVLKYLERCLQQGFEPQSIVNGPHFQDLRGTPEFLAMLERPRRAVRVFSRRARLPNPLDSIGIGSQ